MAAKRIVTLILGSALFWCLVVLPARHLPEAARAWLGRDKVVEVSLASLITCLIPAAGTLYLGLRSLKGPPDLQVLMMLGGAGVRMFFTLIVGLVLYKLVPYYEANDGIWIWLVVFYLFTLGFELALLLKSPDAQGGKDS